MPDGLFSTVALDRGARAGYRLQHLEVYNWGTFDKRIWRLTPNGDTALLTGDIGSGKSTLVDAVTTLLMPANRIAYNKAAGAEAKERTLRSYVEGHHKSERVEATGTSRAVGLRDHRSYSVVLAVFGNDGYDETVTLAQVFHQRDRAGQPERFFVTSSKALSIEADFTAFGDDLGDLRKRLRAGGNDVNTTFPDYARKVRSLLGIGSEQALELFHQTVSMKSVGNLNDFVRSHMLEPVDASERVSGILAHFDDLTTAHDAVARAREQLAALTPLVEAAARYDEALGRRTAAEAERATVRVFVAEQRVTLLDTEIADLAAERDQRQREADGLDSRLEQLRLDQLDLVTERAAAGGDRIHQLETEAAHARTEAQQRRLRRVDLATALEAAGLPAADDEPGFAALAIRTAGLARELEAAARAADEYFAGLAGRRREVAEAGRAIREELTSLEQRSNNLPPGQVELREQLCADLGLATDAVPFAGELLDVAPEHAAWRGAAERVLRGLALSLLVPETEYSRVAAWVNARRLTGRRGEGVRLVYERVPERRVALQPAAPDGALRLADTVEIAEGPFADHLRSELIRRADHVCVDTVEEFRRERRAVTREGQVRSGDRHEKDDRSRVDDPRRWVMGWSNERKIEEFTRELVDLHRQHVEVETALSASESHRDAIRTRRSALERVSLFRSWSEVDVEAAEARAASAERERAALLAGDSALAAIERRLATVKVEIDELAAAVEEARGDVKVLAHRAQVASTARADAAAVVSGTAPDALAAARELYAALLGRLGRGVPRSSSECGPAESALTEAVQASIERAQREMNGHGTNVVSHMNEFRRRWPAETVDLDAHVEARAEYAQFHARVADDDLPRFEQEFRQQLTTNTIRELASFGNWLRRQSDEIHDRVDRINEALGAIDYSPGRYIALGAERTINQEIAQFRSDLRHATDDALAAADPDDDHYSERRFADVARIIERFRGREGHAESDKAWTRRVTDVRNWFTFSASERDRVTAAEWEHYQDSDGKSGGQKEKLAYTILAASLAYQFGLEWGVERARDFRFAVIDEAFGRGSNTSTTYALELFARLGLQLLIVTPLQKVHVIEPYVRAIGFVDNPTGSYSRLQTLTIEEFHDRQSAAP